MAGHARAAGCGTHSDSSFGRSGIHCRTALPTTTSDVGTRPPAPQVAVCRVDASIPMSSPARRVCTATVMPLYPRGFDAAIIWNGNGLAITVS